MIQPCPCPHRTAHDLCVPVSHDHVRDALDTLVYSAAPRSPSPLVHLALVDEAAADPELPCSPQIRDYLLTEILTGIIREQFAAQCDCFGLELPHAYATQDQAVAAVTAQSQISSIELLGWAWLYYRCVRVDLAITPVIFSQAAGIDLRTLRRYQHHTIGRLTLQLLKAEYAARQRRHSNREEESRAEF